MMIALASDHGGLQLKDAVKELLRERGLEFEDCGTDNGGSVDYPDFGEKVARKVAAGAVEKGILLPTSFPMCALRSSPMPLWHGWPRSITTPTSSCSAAA